jgi:hypothetical protein
MSGTLFIGEQRRFRRMSLPLKTRILPKHPLSGKAIKSWGIDYFPPAIQAQCQTTLETLKTQIAQIHEHHDLIEALTSEAVDQITFFGQLIQSLSQGEQPLKQKAQMERFKNALQGFKRLSTIEKTSPKAHHLLKLIEEKNRHLYESVRQFLSQATEHRVSIPAVVPLCKIDEEITLFHQPRYHNIPLAQALVYLVRYQRLHQQIWQNILQDLDENLPLKAWPEQEVSLSMGGLGLQLPKRFPPMVSLHCQLALPNLGMESFEGAAVLQKTLLNEGAERVSIDFKFPSAYQQATIRTQLELLEIKHAMEVFGA